MNSEQLKNMIICPISGLVFFNPYVASDGMTYELFYLYKLFTSNKGKRVISPITNKTLKKCIFPNKKMKELVEYCLQEGIITKDEQNTPPFCLRTFVEHLDKGEIDEIRKMILISKFDKNIYELHPINVICRLCDEETISLAIDNCLNVEIADEDGNRPIHYICKKKPQSLNLLKKLIDRNVNINAPGHLEKTPLSVAREVNNNEIVEFLIANGAKN